MRLGKNEALRQWDNAPQKMDCNQKAMRLWNNETMGNETMNQWKEWDNGTKNETMRGETKNNNNVTMREWVNESMRRLSNKTIVNEPEGHETIRQWNNETMR